MKTVWMISGNKGGVGKSLFCLALASMLEKRDEHYAILDGDGRTGDVYNTFLRKVPARWGDFRELRPESHDDPLDQKYEEMLHQLLSDSDHLIVNTPDGADKILTKWFDVTLKHTELNNYVFKFIYLISDRPDGLDILDELTKRFQFLYVFRNLHFADYKYFTDFNNGYSHLFKSICDFPALRADEARMLFNLKTYPLEALALIDRNTDCFSIPLLTRQRIRTWLDLAGETITDIIENDEVSNVKSKNEQPRL